MTEFVLPASDLTLDRALSLLWRRRRSLVKIGLGFGLLGVVYALLTPAEYTSETRLMPEFQAGATANLQRFGALADLVGIDLEGVNTTEAVRPDLYPDVLMSTPFLLTVLNQSVTGADKKTYPTLVAFLANAHPNPLTAWLDTAPVTMPITDSLGQSVRLTREQDDLLNDVRERILSDLDPRSGLISVRVKMPDAEVAAQVCQQAIQYLKRYVLRYRTDKTRADLTFITQRLAEAKARYDRSLDALSAYADQNRFLYSQSARVEGKRLEAENTLAQTLYDELSRRYEQTRLKIQEQTPILSVLEPPKVPARRSEPRRTLLVLAFTGAGLVAGIVWILARALVGL